ncbi:hypothetical protein Tco_0778160 [Tanacetum coccineum]
MTQLCDLDPMLHDIKILARYINIWKSHPVGKPNDVWSLDIVLQDPQEHVYRQLANFGVGENGGKFPTLNHRYKLNFFKNTAVTRVASFDNNTRGFKFEHFTAFTSRRFSDTELCGVIGTIVSISDAIPFNTFGVYKIRRTIILEDVEDSKLECCFFDSLFEEFAKLRDERDSMDHVVMILQLAKDTYFNEELSGSGQRTSNNTLDDYNERRQKQKEYK